jgi:hypothetical protein
MLGEYLLNEHFANVLGEYLLNEHFANVLLSVRVFVCSCACVSAIACLDVYVHAFVHA